MTVRSPSLRRKLLVSSRVGTLLSAVLLLVNITGMSPSGVPGAAAAAVAGVAQVIEPPGGSPTTVPLAGGGSSTAFSLALPAAASCSGDSANDGFSVRSYFVAEATDPATLTFDTSGPTTPGTGASFRQPLFDGTGTPFTASTAPADPVPGPGQVVGIPALTFLAFAEAPPPGTYNLGVACVKGPASDTQLDKFWNARITITASASDTPGGFTFATLAPPDATTTTTSASTSSTTGSTTSTTTRSSTTTTTVGAGSTTTTTAGGCPTTSTTGSSTTTAPGATTTSTTVAPTTTTTAGSTTTSTTVGSTTTTAPGATTTSTTAGPTTTSTTATPTTTSTTATPTTTTTVPSTTTSTTGSSTTTSTAPGATTTSTTAPCPAPAGGTADGGADGEVLPSGGSPTGTSVAGSLANLPLTGGSATALVVWSGLLLIFGRMAILLARPPRLLPMMA